MDHLFQKVDLHYKIVDLLFVRVVLLNLPNPPWLRACNAYDLFIMIAVTSLGVYHSAMDQYRLPVIVMEKMQRSLTGLVENYDNIPLNVKLSILDEVSLGLRYLHSRNPQIVHRDLTPNNILLGVHLEAKITDLGVAKVVRSDN